MTRRRFALAAFILLPFVATAQDPETSVELFAGEGLTAGLLPVHIAGVSHVDPYAGFQGHLGFQAGRMALGAGVHLWEMAKENDFGGHGVHFLLFSEFKRAPASETFVRLSFGYQADVIDQGFGSRPSADVNGDIWGAGIGHEMRIRGQPALFTAELMVPRSPKGALTEQRPMLNLGVGFRERWWHPLHPGGGHR